MESRTERQSEDAEMRAYFAAFDKDSNGYIDANELKTTLRDLGMTVRKISNNQKTCNSFLVCFDKMTVFWSV